MSEISVKIQKIFISTHPNADSLEIGNIGSPDGFQVVVRKGQYEPGDLVAYVGENAVVPADVLKRYGFWNVDKNKGMLAGPDGTIVRGVRLRGEFSLGICIPVDVSFNYETDNYVFTLTRPFISPLSPFIKSVSTAALYEGSDVTEFLGVTKHVGKIPSTMAGEVYNYGQHIGVNYDIENIKNYTRVLEEGEEVQITEKIHGTNFQIVVLPNQSEFHHDEHLFIQRAQDTSDTGYIAVSSKGLGAKGLFLKHNEQNKNNVYLHVTRPYYSNLIAYLKDTPFTVVGEIFGNGVQDLTYGMLNQQKMLRVFDVYVGMRHQGRWLEDKELDEFCSAVKMERVPILYRGPYSKELVLGLSQHTKSVFDPKQIREGVVIKAVPERQHHRLGRTCLKLINEDYLTRKGSVTEFN
jgi:RNA ligase (TIGR02306 family)